jgi:hypothetical protein
MKLEPGFIVVIASMIFFYVRLIQLRGRRKKERREEELERLRAPKKRKPGDPAPLPVGERPMIKIASWWLVSGGAILMLGGLALRTSPELLPFLGAYWWVVTALGVLVFAFSLK